LPKNPLHINCECEVNYTSSTGDEVDSEQRRHLANHIEELSRLVDRNDVVIKTVDRGVFFRPSTQFKVWKCLFQPSLAGFSLEKVFPKNQDAT